MAAREALAPVLAHRDEPARGNVGSDQALGESGKPDADAGGGEEEAYIAHPVSPSRPRGKRASALTTAARTVICAANPNAILVTSQVGKHVTASLVLECHASVTAIVEKDAGGAKEADMKASPVPGSSLDRY